MITASEAAGGNKSQEDSTVNEEIRASLSIPSGESLSPHGKGDKNGSCWVE